MLRAIFVILLLLWLLGLMLSYALGGLAYVLLVIALAVLLIQIVHRQGAV